MKKSIINYCKNHSEDLLSEYVLKGIREAKIRKETEHRKWKSIAEELRAIGSRRKR